MGRLSFPPAEPFTELALNRQVSEPISAPSRLTAFLPGALASNSPAGPGPVRGTRTWQDTTKAERKPRGKRCCGCIWVAGG